MARPVLALGCLLFLLSGVAAAQAPPEPIGVRASFNLPRPTLTQPPQARAPWLGAPIRTPAQQAAAWQRQVDARTATEEEAAAHQRTLAVIYGANNLSVALSEASEPERKNLLGLPAKYADLRIDGSAFLEIRSDKVKNLRCTPAQLLDRNSGCRGGFKAPRLDNEFNAKIGGVIGNRLHVNVDYDSRREFNANNDMQVYYQGLQDEILQRVEIGTVTFRIPASRFLTAAIPANNFGLNATFEFGPLTLQTMMATQEGSVVSQRTYTIGGTTSEPQDRQVRDVDFESGRFYWAVDPVTLPNYPFVDILNLDAVTIPPSVQPADAQVRVYRYRTGAGSGLNPNLGGITAVALRPDGPERIEGTWQLLLQGSDYYLDPSATWFALANKLDQNDYLAVSYVTVNGTRVGTFPAAENPAVSDTLLLIALPRQGPQQQTFRHEMRQVYRVSGTDLDRASLKVSVTLNQSERPSSSSALTYLAFFGLATAPDPHIFDLDNRLFPRLRDPGADLVLRESYIAYPELQPFADPRLAPNERADSVYTSPVYLLLTPQGPPSRFQMRLQYSASGGTEAGTLNLNALQVRRGSEQLVANGRILERGVDYEINYDLGQVTFLNPAALFPSGRGSLSARFEERGIFAVAPTSILGSTLSYSLGQTGSINLVGMYQKEQSVFNRPTLGFEPTSNLLGGITADLTFQPMGVTRFFDRLSPQGVTAPSRLDIRAEYGMTVPDPNRLGVAYLEDFEGESAIPLPLFTSRWEYGSVPQSPLGVEALGFAGGFDSSWAVQMSWQNLVPACSGCPPVELLPQDIDPTIITNGTGNVNETVLYLTFHADTAGGMVETNTHSLWSLPPQPFTPRWRSLVTPISQVGLDLTRSEYLEFWVFQGGEQSLDSSGVELVVDLGSVSEDALAIAPESLTVTGSDSLYTGRQYTGVGVLNSERQSTGIFNAASDDIGILMDRIGTLDVNGVPTDNVQTCKDQLSNTVPVYPWGDLGSRCTVGNGFLDTEDLNGDNRLNAQGSNDNVFRWVIKPNDQSPYFVRYGATYVDQQGRTSTWSLYRIPMRIPGYTIGSPNLRLIQNLRMTFAAPPDAGPDVVARFALARARFIGAPWVRRSDTPLLGISSPTASPTGTMFAAVISTEDVALGYVSPPGVTNETAANSNGQSVQGVQINEKSLRIVASALDLGERAEAYQRFASGAQNLLKYQQVQVWFRGRGDGWASGDLRAYFKIGSDDRNFYMYLTPALSTTWSPQALISIPEWRQLRADIEQRWLNGDPPSGAATCGIGDPLAYVACSGPYVVQVADPGVNPPNLASAQEMSAGIYREANSEALGQVELWVDDIRLSNPVTDVGSSMAMDVRLQAADVADFSVNYVRQGGLFQQIGVDPTYRTTGALVLGTNIRVERFLPANLGLAIPFSINYSRTNVAPILIGGTDILASDISNLRMPSNWLVSYSLGVRRTKRGTSWLSRGLLDPLTFSGTYARGSSQTELSAGSTSAATFILNYSLILPRIGPTVTFGAVDSLPAWLSKTEAAQGVRRTQFGLLPTNIRATSQLLRTESDFTGYLVPVYKPGDAALRPAVSLTNLWLNSAGINWMPVGMLSLAVDLGTTRDLRNYDDTTSIGRLTDASRQTFLGLDVGVERDRNLTTSLNLTPKVTSWLRPRYQSSSSFILSRSLTSRAPIQEFGDSGAYILPQTINNVRTRQVGVSLDPAKGFRRVMSDSTLAGRALRGIRAFDISLGTSRLSTFDLATFDPGLGYMLALGGLDQFLAQGRDSALGATETKNLTFGGGADLPYGIVATLQYTLADIDRYTRASNGYLLSQTSQREWPIVSARWTRPLPRGPVALVGFSTSYRQRNGSTELPSVIGSALTTTETSTWTNDLSLSFRNGLNLTLGYGVSGDKRLSNGTTTNGTGQDLTANLIYTFRMPGSIGNARKQIRASVNALSSKAVSCLDLPDTAGCKNVSDVRRKTLRAGLDTDILQILTGGLQAAYAFNDARQINRATSQLTLSMTFQLSLFSGDY